MEHNDEQVTVLGAGSVGVAWSLVFARAGRPVVLYDVDEGRLALAAEEIGTRLIDLIAADLLDEPANVVAGRVRFEVDVASSVAGARYIQECVPEQLPLKKALFASIEEAISSHAVLASSSSAITASRSFGGLATRERCLVAHPGNPPYLLPIVELVPAPFTAPAVVEWTYRFLTAAGMRPIVVRREIEGFVFNRLQGALLREAYCLVRDGVADVADVDLVVSQGLGPRWASIGPFETADLNTRGGIAAHADRMGPAYHRMGAERGQDDPWTPELVADVTAQRRAILPLSSWNDRVRWRDRTLMALTRALRD